MVGSPCINLSNDLGSCLHARVVRGQALQISRVLVASFEGGAAASEQFNDGVANLACIVINIGIDEPRAVALLAPGETPDEWPIARVEFGDAGLLLDHLRPVQTQPR